MHIGQNHTRARWETDCPFPTSPAPDFRAVTVELIRQNEDLIGRKRLADFFDVTPRAIGQWLDGTSKPHTDAILFAKTSKLMATLAPDMQAALPTVETVCDPAPIPVADCDRDHNGRVDAIDVALASADCVQAEGAEGAAVMRALPTIDADEAAEIARAEAVANRARRLRRRAVELVAGGGR